MNTYDCLTYFSDPIMPDLLAYELNRNRLKPRAGLDLRDELLNWIYCSEVDREDDPSYWIPRASMYQAIKEHICRILAE